MTHKTKSETWNETIVAVKHPPREGMTAERPGPFSPYITKEQLVSGVDELGHRIEEEIINALAFSPLTEALFEGVYPPSKKNPIFAMEAFLLFHRVGLYPPHWVLDWMEKAFSDYLESGGEEDLLYLLGVKRGPGKTEIFKEHRTQTYENNMMHEIGHLTLLRISIEKAAEMVSARLDKENFDHPTTETLMERFSKRGWSKIYKQLEKILPSSRLDAIRAGLSNYPGDTIPAKFR